MSITLGAKTHHRFRPISYYRSRGEFRYETPRLERCSIVIGVGCGPESLGSAQTRKPSLRFAESCARMACTLFMIFFWWPTRVTPSEVSSLTVSLTTDSMFVTPARSKFSKYRDIFKESSHSSTEVNCVISGASGASGLQVLERQTI